MEQGKFVSLFYGILNIKEKSLTYTNAGHCYPLIFDQKGEFKELEKGGLVLGVLDDYPYQEEKIVLQPGELLLLYTDGIIEAFNEKDEQFEEERLVKVVQENLSLDAEEISQQIVNRVIAFQEDVPQSDDLTLVVVNGLSGEPLFDGLAVALDDIKSTAWWSLMAFAVLLTFDFLLSRDDFHAANSASCFVLAA